MNIIHLNTHDIGRYVEPYGYAIPAPNLMRFARESTLFRHTYCAAPSCSASRAAMLTGQCSHSSGMTGLVNRGFGLKNPGQHLASFLRGHGFETVLVGLQHETGGKTPAEAAKRLGYEANLLPTNVDTSGEPDKTRHGILHAAATGQVAAEWLRGRGRQTKPFLLSVGFGVTHRVFPHASPEVNPNYVMPFLPFYDCAQNRQDTADYIEGVRALDAALGPVFQAIRETGREEDTVIFFTTDHGPAFPKMKCHLYDPGIGVALMMTYPGNPSRGKALDGLVSQVDVFPTLCDLVGLPRPDYLQGVSFLPLLKGEAERVREETFSEVSYHAAYEPQRCARTERYKLIRYFGDYDRVVAANTDAGLSKEFYVRHGWLDRPHAREMLFDLYLDPMERENVADDPAYAAVHADLSARLARWMEATDDPMLTAVEGRFPPPPGARVNLRESLEPAEAEFMEEW